MSFETWTAQKRTIGKNHPHCVTSLFLLAESLQGQSKLEAALNIKRDVYAQAVALVGPKRQYTLIVAASLASCLVASASANGSFAAYEEASDLYKSRFCQTTRKHCRLEPTWPRCCGYVGPWKKRRRSSVRH